MRATEKTLRPIVEAWLQKYKYYVAHEVMLCGYCDLIGCKWEERIGRRIPRMREIIAVELKINDIRGVLYQAKNNRYYADTSYAAMPINKCARMKPEKLQLFKNIGVGLLGVSFLRGVVIIVPAQKNLIKHNPNVCRRLWNFKLRHKKELLSERK
jgi:hypothetical protein